MDLALASKWLGGIIQAAPASLPLLCRAAAVSPEMLRKALQEPKVLSQTQWALMLAAARPEGAWPQTGQETFVADLAALKAALRRQHNRTPKPLAELRKKNFQRLTAYRGAITKIADRLGIRYQGIGGLGTGRNVFGTSKARQLEATLELPVGWFDQDEPVIPDSVRALLEAPPASPQPGALARTGPGGISRLTEGESTGLPMTTLPTAMQRAVAEKFASLALAGLITDQHAFEILGRLMEFEKSAFADR